jgi:hypothetical protein
LWLILAYPFLEQFADAMLTDDVEESEEEGEEGSAPSEAKERYHECVICSVSSKVKSSYPTHAAGEWGNGCTVHVFLQVRRP